MGIVILELVSAGAGGGLFKPPLSCPTADMVIAKESIKKQAMILAALFILFHSGIKLQISK